MVFGMESKERGRTLQLALAFLGTHTQMITLLAPWMVIHHGSLSSSQETLYDVKRILRDAHTLWLGVDFSQIPEDADLSELGIDLDALGFAGVTDTAGIYESMRKEPPIREIEMTLACMVTAVVLAIAAFVTRAAAWRGGDFAKAAYVAMLLQLSQLMANIVGIGIFTSAVYDYADSSDITSHEAGVAMLVISILLAFAAVTYDIAIDNRCKKAAKQAKSKLGVKGSRGERKHLLAGRRSGSKRSRSASARRCEPCEPCEDSFV